MPEPIATWNPARSVWETNESLICGHSAAWLETWPRSGMTRSGRWFPLPASAPPTDANVSSSSRGLPTPMANDWRGPNETRRSDPARSTTLSDVTSLLPTPEAKLGSSGPDYARAGRPTSGGDDLATSMARLMLPTPCARDWRPMGPATLGRNSPQLEAIESLLLPTPDAAMAKGGHHSRGGKRSEELLLPGVVLGLFPTPTASDGNRSSQGFSRGNPTLPGAVTSVGETSPEPSDGGNTLWDE